MILTIQGYNTIDTVKLNLGSNTFVYGENCQLKHDVKNSIVGYLNKLRWSTLDKESNIKPVLYIDGEKVSTSSYDFFYIPGVINIGTEMKLGTDSVIKNLLLKKLSFIFPFNEELNTIQMLMNDFIIDCMNQEDGTSVYYHPTEYSEKDIIGLVKPKYLVNELEISSKKISYYEMMRKVVLILKEITRLSGNKVIILFDDFGYGLSQKEAQELYDLTQTVKSDYKIYFPQTDIQSAELKNINLIHQNHIYYVEDKDDLMQEIEKDYPRYDESEVMENMLMITLKEFPFQQLMNQNELISIFDHYQSWYYIYKLLEFVGIGKKYNFITNESYSSDPFYCYLKNEILEE